MIIYGTTSKVLNDGRTYYFVTLNGQIPSSATRYKTRQGAEREAKRRYLAAKRP
jgi:hypothetical protein